KLSIPICTGLSHFVRRAAWCGLACELADARHLPSRVELREPDDVGATFANERTMLHDRDVLTLAGVKHNARTIFPAGDAQRADARPVSIRLCQPSHLTLR